MRKKLLASYILITLLVTAVSAVFIYNRTQAVYMESQADQLAVSGELLADILNELPKEEALEAVYAYDEALNLRISIISAEPETYGKVLVDTQYDEEIMGNHQYREEIKQALAGQAASSVRQSSTLKIDFLYMALPVKLHGEAAVLRLAEPLAHVQAMNVALMRMSVVWVAVVIALGILVYGFSLKRLTKPLDEINEGVLKVAAGDYQVKLPIYHDEQFKHLADSFNDMVARQRDFIDGLQMKNAEMQAVFNSVGVGIAFFDVQQQIKMHNDLFCQLLRLDAAKIEGRQFFEVLHKPELLEMLESGLNDGVYGEQDLRFDLGEEKIYHVKTAPVRARDFESYTGLLLVIEDITQLKHLENMRREFVANVSHELKTPMTSIRGFIETLKNGAIDDEAVSRRFLSIIDDEAERLYRMIQQLLYLSEIENQPLSGTVSAVDLTKLTEEIALYFEKQLSDKALTLQTAVTGEAVYYGDGDGLMQIVLNLVDNAIKYSTAGEIVLRFKNDGQKLTVTVSDQGMGIAPEDQKRIFERFYRAEKSRSQKNGGTGLGLAIVKHLVENLHGVVRVESVLGKGSDFIVELPCQNEKMS